MSPRRGRSARLGAVVPLAVALAAGCHAHGSLDAARVLEATAGARLAPVSAAERREAIRRAHIFADVDVAARNLLAGPPDPLAFPFEHRISCDYVEPRLDRVPVGGTTPKFLCTLRHGHGHADVFIKYGQDNFEIYGQVLGSRLFWALGVAADRAYPVRVRCHDCPADPWQPYREFPRLMASPRRTRELDDAIVQRLYPGAPIEECLRAAGGRCVARRDDEGWTFDELDGVDAGAEVDALRLLAAFVAHGDDKPSNQRLVCPIDAIDAAGRCRAPRLMIADLGSTFGRGASTVFRAIDRQSRPSFARWSTLPVWQDPATCRAWLVTRVAPPHPRIHEAGRRLLAARLAALSDEQLRDLFVVARVEEMGETRIGPDGRSHAVTVDDWVEAFRRRRAQIVEHRCPP